jgi:hypothetical protein
VAVAASAFPGTAGDALRAAGVDLLRSAAACNRKSAVWRSALAGALGHLEDLVAAITGRRPYPVEPAGTAKRVATRAAEVSEATRGHLLGGGTPVADSDFWWNDLHAGQNRNLEVARSNGRRFEVLFVGDSTMANAADPERFADLDGRTAYNASLAGSGPEIVRKWLDQTAVGLARPDLVVIGVEPRTFRRMKGIPGSCAEPTDTWNDARRMREAAFDPVAALRGVPTGRIFFGNPPSPRPGRPLAAEDEFRTNYSRIGKRLTFPQISEAQKQLLLDVIRRWADGYRPCRERLEILRRIIRDLKGDGMDAVVVATPVSDLAAGAFTDGRATIDDLLGTVADLAGRAGAGFVDLSDAIDDSDFRDLNHVDAAGARRFTTMLVNRLEEISR